MSYTIHEVIEIIEVEYSLAVTIDPYDREATTITIRDEYEEDIIAMIVGDRDERESDIEGFLVSFMGSLLANIIKREDYIKSRGR